MNNFTVSNFNNPPTGEIIENLFKSNLLKVSLVLGKDCETIEVMYKGQVIGVLNENENILKIISKKACPVEGEITGYSSTGYSLSSLYGNII